MSNVPAFIFKNGCGIIYEVITTKKLISLLLILIMCFCSVAGFADGEEYATVSRYGVSIDYTPIDSYIVDNLTYISVEDLLNYGFDVTFDETTQSYNVSRIKFATPMYTREMWEQETLLKTDLKIEYSNIKVYIDDEIANSCFAGGKALLQIDELQRYGVVEWDDYYSKTKVYIFREEMQRELDNAENVVELELEDGTYKGQVDENNQPHGIGKIFFDKASTSFYDVTYMGNFTHSNPDGIVYKETKYSPFKSYVFRSAVFIGEVDGTKKAEKIYEYVEPVWREDPHYGLVKVQDGFNKLVGKDPNFGILCLPVKEIVPWSSPEYNDETVYIKGCYFEDWYGKDGTHEHRIWHNGDDKQTVLHYSFGVGDNREAIDSVRRLGTDASHISAFYEYTNGVLDMHTGFINTSTKNGINNPVDGARSFITVLLDGKGIVFDVLPIKDNDRVVVPIRAISEALGATISWDNKTMKTTIKKGATNIVLQIGNNVMEVNDSKILLDTAPEIFDSRTMVPVRAVSEAFKAQVDWDNEFQQVIIRTDLD
ncbi:MAG: copper amine oxidase N-terminal domain-containing protein [Clostridia bacterium]|nr:copper amine oxidase N-terminal domain-containing protein [Clostridia bacterium]